MNCVLYHLSYYDVTNDTPLPGALVEFDAAAAMDASDHVSANNKAVCYMFGGNLMGAIQVSLFS